MLLLNLTSLALAALAGTAPRTTVQVVPAVAADSEAETALTADQLTNYIAVKKALEPFWRTHGALLQTAQSTAHARIILIGQQQLQTGLLDYPTLVKQDATLATIFTTNHLAPEQFGPTQVAALKALGTLVMAEATNAALPATSTALGKNVVLVKTHRRELAAAGIALVTGEGGKGGLMPPPITVAVPVPGMGGSMGGTPDPLDP